MRLTKYDRGADPLAPKPQKSRTQLCREAGFNTKAIGNWRQRNPGSTLTDEEIIQDMVNRRDSK